MNSESPRILFVGGADLHLRIPFMRALKGRGVKLLALGSGDNTRFAGSGVDYRCYKLKRSFNPLADYCSVRAIRSIAREFNPEIVHAFDTKPSILVPLALPDTASRRCVRTITGLGYLFSGQRLSQRILRQLYLLMQRLASPRAAVTIFQNRDDREFFESTNIVGLKHSALVLGSGVDSSEIYARVDSRAIEVLRDRLKLKGKLVVLMAARINANKGVFEYCLAANEISAMRPDVSFILAGACETGTADSIRESDLREACGVVQFLGDRSDLANLMALSDVFVLPSYYREGVPRVLLEAGALEKALITTDMPGCREVVEHARNGLLIKARDAAQLRNAITQLLEHPDERVLFGKRARDKIENEFSLDKVLEQYWGIYISLLAARMK